MQGALIIILIIVVVILILIKLGNKPFWNFAKNNPEIVYRKILEDDSWIVGDIDKKDIKKEIDGPFFLYIPSLGKSVKFYGIVGLYEESQKRIIDEGL